MITPKDIGSTFKEARESRGLSVKEAYQKTRIHPDVIRNIENGIFDKINEIYLKSFLKEYGTFLKLDLDGIMKRYKEVSSKVQKKDFDPNIKKEEAPGESGRVQVKKEITHAHTKLFEINTKTKIVAICLVAFVVLAFFRRAPEKARELPVQHAVEKVVPKRAVKEKVAPKPVVQKVAAPKLAPVEKPKPAPRKKKKEKPVTLALKSRKNVWVKISKGNEILYTGVLKRNRTKTLESKGTLTVWTGNTSVVEFTVNGHKAGIVGRGVIKNIMVSSRGIQIGDKWITRL